MRRRRRRFPYRRFWRLIWIGLILLTLVSYYQLRELCGENFEQCEISDTAIAWTFLIAMLLLIARVIIRLRGVRAENAAASEGGFKGKPWEYDRHTIKLYGRVEKVFRIRVSDRIRKGLTDIFRNLLRSGDPIGRYVHQTFLISSPLLRKDCNLFIIHNVKYGSLKLKPGRWVQVQGQYIHNRSRQRGPFGITYTYYGRLHKTHPPDGFCNVLDGEPVMTDKDIVEVIPDKRKETQPKL